MTGRGRHWVAKTSHTRLGTHLSLPGPSLGSMPLGNDSPADKILAEPAGRDRGLDPSSLTPPAPWSELWPSLMQTAHPRALSGGSHLTSPCPT